MVDSSDTQELPHLPLRFDWKKESDPHSNGEVVENAEIRVGFGEYKHTTAKKRPPLKMSQDTVRITPNPMQPVPDIMSVVPRKTSPRRIRQEGTAVQPVEFSSLATLWRRFEVDPSYPRHQ